MQDKLDSDKEVNKLPIIEGNEDTINNFKEKLQEITEEKPKMDFDNPDFLKPYRLETETPYQYKVRRLLGQLYVKSKKKGQFMWISKDMRQPVFDKEDTKMEGKPIGYQISKGFTYNKAKVKKALDKYIKEKETQSMAETKDININKQA